MILIVISLIVVILYTDCTIVKKTPKIVIFIYGLSFAKLCVCKLIE